MNSNNEEILEKEHPSAFENYWLKFNHNVLKNVRVYFMSFLFLFAWGITILSSMDERLTKIEKDNLDSKSRVIGMTDTGSFLDVETKQLDIKSYSPIVATIIEDYLMQSKHSLMDYSHKTEFLDWGDMFKSQDARREAKNIRTFGTYFVDTTEDENHFSQGKTSYIQFLSKIQIMLRRNELPTSLDSLGYRYDKSADWQVRGNTFWLKMKVDAIAAGVTKGGLAYSNRKTYAYFEVEGYIDIHKREKGINPFGVQFTSVKVKPALNATDAEIQKLKLNGR